MPWDWKGGKMDSGVYDNVLPDADPHQYVERRGLGSRNTIRVYVLEGVYVFKG